MKLLTHFIPLCFTLLFIQGNETTNAQDDYVPENSMNEYVYYIRGELTLDYSSMVYFSEFDSKNEYKCHVIAPLFLSYNRNDLKYFRAEPGKMAEYSDAFLGTTNYFSNNRDENEIFAGMMYAQEWFKSTTAGMVSEKKAKGEIDQTVDIRFIMSNIDDEMKSGGDHFTYRLFINAVSCPTCVQNNVTGSTVSEGFSNTQGITLDINFVWGVTYGTDLTNALIENNFIGVDNDKKDTFEAEFEREYYKTLPEIDATKLNGFLIHPQGNYEVPFSGYFNSPDGVTEKTSFKGTLRLFGNEVHKYWVEGPEE